MVNQYAAEYGRPGWQWVTWPRSLPYMVLQHSSGERTRNRRQETMPGNFVSVPFWGVRSWLDAAVTPTPTLKLERTFPCGWRISYFSRDFIIIQGYFLTGSRMAPAISDDPSVILHISQVSPEWIRKYTVYSVPWQAYTLIDPCTNCCI